MPSEHKTAQLGPKPVKTKIDEPKDKNLEGDSEEEKKIEDLTSQIETILEALAPEVGDASEYQDFQLESLCADAEKYLELSGATIIAPLAVLEKAKEILMHRLHAVIDDEKSYNKKREPDRGMLRRTKLAMLLVNDDYIRVLYSHRQDSKIKDFIDLDYFLSVGGEGGGKFSEKEINILIKNGYGEILINGLDPHSLAGGALPRVIPESLLVLYLQSPALQDRKLEQIIENAKTARKKYSKKIFDLVLSSHFSYFCLDNFKVFEGGDIYEAIRNYSFSYPYRLDYELKKVKELGLDTPEVVAAIVQNNWMGDRHTGERELLAQYPGYQDIYSWKIYQLPPSWSIKEGTKKIEEGLPIARELVESGNLGLLKINQFQYVEWFVENEYDWLMEQAARHKQEHLLFKYMKPETQVAYVERLIEKKDKAVLVHLFTINRDRKLLEEHLFGIDIYTRLCAIIPGRNIKLKFFNNLPPELYLGVIVSSESYARDRKIFSLVESFNFEGEDFKTEKLYQDFIKKLKGKSVISDEIYNNMPSESPIFFSNFEKLSEEERGKWIEILVSLRDIFPANLGSYELILNQLLQSKLGSHHLFSLLENEPGAAQAYIFSIAKIVNLFLSDYSKLEREISNIYRLNISPVEISGITSAIFSLQTFLKVAEFSAANESFLLREIAKSRSAAEADASSKKIQMLSTEVSKYEENLQVHYIRTFLVEEKSEEERKQYLERINKDMDILAHNQQIKTDDETYKVICEMVYPRRNYDTLKNIDSFTDRSSDIAEFKFDRKGYGVLLDGVSEYRVKEGEEINPAILRKYSGKVEKLVSLAAPGALEDFLQKKMGEEKDPPKTLEGKILRYLEDKSEDEIADILFAYQLRGEYEAFVQGTRDRIGDNSSQAEKEYIMLTELAERFGDRLKETIKQILREVEKSGDKKLFAVAQIKFTEEDLVALGHKITNDLAKIPKEKMTDQVVQKKVLTSLKTRFQKIPSIVSIAESISSQFSVESVPFIAENLIKLISESMKDISSEGGIDSKKIEAIQNKCYAEISRELEKYEEVMEVEVLKKALGEQEKSTKKRKIRGYFSKNRENAHARMVADVCIAEDAQMLENPNYFEFVLFDEDRKKNIGTVMLLVMEEPKGKKYLLYCPNPSTDIVSKVSATKLYQWLTRQVSTFASENGFEAILTDTRHGHATNRPGKFHEALSSSVVRSRDGSPKKVSLKQPHMLSTNYIYQNDLSVIWEK